MKLKFHHFFAIAILIGLVSSCAPSKSIIYLQDFQNVNPNLQSYTNSIQPDDNVMIMVTADEAELAAPFNIVYLTNESTNSTSTTKDAMVGYLVDINGEIDFPRIGKIKIGGLDRISAEQKIKDLLRPHIKNPGINLRILNFKISVLGEVGIAGSQKVEGDRITFLEALSNAGDLTIYGRRDNILVIRDFDGKKSFSRVDITSADFINSPYFYLTQNDQIVVEPNKTKINASAVGPNTTAIFSALSLLISIIVILLK